MARVEVDIDRITVSQILRPPKLDDVFEREQAIGEARGLMSIDIKVREKIAELEKELAEHERPDSAERRDSAVNDAEITGL